MMLLSRKKYSFVSTGTDKDTFSVVSFKGFEAISKPYEFEIHLVSKNTEIDPLDVLENPAKFTIHRDEKEDVDFNGILMQFEETREFNGYLFFRAVLVPKLWWLSLTHHNQVFIEKSVPEIMKTALEDGGLFSGLDFVFDLKGPGEKLGGDLEYDDHGYPRREYVCQYDESHFDFVSRWAEREGIYYFFEQTPNGEKVVFTDSKIRHEDMPLGRDLVYDPPSGLAALHTDEVIHAFVCKHNKLPQKVRLKDYNYLKPSQTVEGICDVDDRGRGTNYIYGVYFDTVEEGNRLAEIRADALKCRKSLFIGQSSVPFMEPGYTFNLKDHYKDIYNRKYLITEVSHQGHQTGYLISGLNKAVTQQEEEMSYANSFTGIYSDAQFRPEHVTTKPKITGTINAKVDGPANSAYAQLDEHGRYKVILPFDLSGPGPGQGSARFRMVQPYAGENQGFHFPLHKGTEVVLTFIDGNPDRPLIAGAVPNPETPSPSNESNPYISMIKTGRGFPDQSLGAGDATARTNSNPNNYIQFDDATDQEKIKSHSPGTIEHHASEAGSLIKTHTPGTVEVEAGKRYRRLELGTSEESGHDRYDTAGTATIGIPAAKTQVDGLIEKIEEMAPGNVWGYDEQAELAADANAIPANFPWAFTEAPVPDCPSSFDTFFEDTPRIWCFRDNDPDEYDYEDLDDLYDDIDDAWKEYFCYWVQRHNGTYPNAKGYQNVTYVDPLDNTNQQPLSKPWYYDAVWDTDDDDPNQRLGDYLDKTTLDAHCQTEWNAWVNEKKADLKKWRPHVYRGHIRAHHRDTFKYQEGNVYDLKGYNSYKLGPRYRETNVSRYGDINTHESFDMLDAGGPNWTGFRTVQSSLEGGSGNELDSFWGKGNWDPGEVLVKKRNGDAYEYVKGNKISVVDGNFQNIVVGGKTIEEKYTSDVAGTGKVKRRYYKSGSGKKWEKKWSKSAKLLYDMTETTSGSDYDQKTKSVTDHTEKTETVTYHAKRTKTAHYKDGCSNTKEYNGGVSDNKYYLAGKSSIEVGAQGSFKFKCCLAADLEIPMYLGLKLKFPLKVGGLLEVGSVHSFEFKYNFSASMKVQIDDGLLDAKKDTSGGYKILFPGGFCEKKMAQMDATTFSANLKEIIQTKL